MEMFLERWEMPLKQPQSLAEPQESHWQLRQNHPADLEMHPRQRQRLLAGSQNVLARHQSHLSRYQNRLLERGKGGHGGNILEV
jgi:hypothetical protein